MEQIRSFIAIELSDEVKVALRQVQRELKRSRVAQIARWVSPDGIHLTLKFLGNVAMQRLGEIERVLYRACEPYAPFPVSLTEPGCFPNTRRARVIWIGIGGDVETLARLHDAVESGLKPLGFEPERRGFTPHLTLARIRNRARPQERQEMAQWVSGVQVGSDVSMTVREVSLIRSDLRPTGAVYTRLAAVPLSDE